MSYSEDQDFVSINLQEYGEPRLNSAGELELSPRFNGPIQLDLGDDRLELTRMSPFVDATFDGAGKAESLYILRNLSVSSPEAMIILDNVQRLTQAAFNGILYDVQQGGSTYTIGRTATPELELSKSVSDEHIRVRIGSLAGNIHFMDLYSENGTIVKLPKADERGLGSPRRTFFSLAPPAPVMTIEEHNQRWTR